MTEQPLSPNTAEMEAMGTRIRAIQERKRERIKWHVGKQTAEMAIAAFTRSTPYRPSGKNRKRKRTKRLL
jgi:hypothetical protein